MNDRIDLYIKRGTRWVYCDATRMHRTLAAAASHYQAVYGVTVRARWSAAS